jgi:hypothetical protein
MGMLRKIFDEYPYKPTSAKKAADTGDIYRYRPVLDFLCFGFMGDMAFVAALR